MVELSQDFCGRCLVGASAVGTFIFAPGSETDLFLASRRCQRSFARFLFDDDLYRFSCCAVLIASRRRDHAERKISRP